MCSILENLIANANKYRDSNRPQSNLRIQLRQIKRNPQIIIRDNGIGIPKHFRHNVFAIEECSVDLLVHTASSGDQALNVLGSLGQAPQIILLDINTLVLNGIEFLREYAKNQNGWYGNNRSHLVRPKFRSRHLYGLAICDQ